MRSLPMNVEIQLIVELFRAKLLDTDEVSFFWLFVDSQDVFFEVMDYFESFWTC